MDLAARLADLADVPDIRSEEAYLAQQAFISKQRLS
jgi:hypothetical protein